MNILVCFKVVPDLDMMPADGWRPDSRLRVDTSPVRRILNVYDESALEMALRLRDGGGEPIRLTALTIGDARCDPFLQNLNALRFDRTVRLEHDEEALSAELVARVLAAFIQENPQDLVLSGRQAGVGDSGKTPYLLAEALGWPCLAQVTGLELRPDGTMTATRQVDGGVARSVVRTPQVAAVGNAPNLCLRFATLRDKMKYGKKPVEVLAVADLQPNDLPSPGDAPELIALERMEHRRAGTIIPGNSPAEKARSLYENHLRPRMEKLSS